MNVWRLSNGSFPVFLRLQKMPDPWNAIGALALTVVGLGTFSLLLIATCGGYGVIAGLRSERDGASPDASAKAAEAAGRSAFTRAISAWVVLTCAVGAIVVWYAIGRLIAFLLTGG